MNGWVGAITGTLGGGKGTLGTEMMCLHLLRGGWVFTNVELYAEKISEWMAEHGRKFDPSRLIFLSGDLAQFHRKILRGTDRMQVMVVIDEASLEFNANDYRDMDKGLLAFVNFCRKLDVILLIITQAFEDVYKQIRKRVSVIWVCRNMKQLKIWGIIPCPLPFYFRVRFDNTRGGGRPIKMDSEIVFKSWAWGLYNSNQLTGKGHEEFLSMQSAEASPLERIEKPKPPAQPTFWPELIAACFAAFFTCF